MGRVLVLAVLVVFAALQRHPTGPRSTDTLPTAEAVLNEYIEATGGKAAYAKFRNRVLSGTVKLVGTDETRTIKIFQESPNRLAIVTELGPTGKSTVACDGKAAWETSLIEGTKLLYGADKDSFLREAMFNIELHLKDLYEKLECVGIEDGGRSGVQTNFSPVTRQDRRAT